MPEKDKVTAINRELEEKEVAARAKQLGLAYVNLEPIPIGIDLLRILSEDEARKGLLLPFFRVGKKLKLAVVEPERAETQEVIKALRDQGYLLSLSLVSKNGLLEAFQEYGKSLVQKEREEFSNVVAEDNLSAYEVEIKNLAGLQEKLQTMGTSEAVNTILVGAMKTGASDVHLEPYEKEARVRFRIDGVMQEVLRLQKKVLEDMIKQLKQKSQLRLNITDEPQDGRFFFMLNERKIDVRVSSLPTVYGESMVMRLLDSGKKALTLQDLGLRGQAFESLQKSLFHPNGIILSTGPTGSGKTTTLYALLGILNNPERKLITLEDPVEYHIEGISQSQIEVEKDYSFAKGLRSILRQDPDVVMVGEIRDLETAEIAAQAAMTGHIVLSTLHTNNAVAAIARLTNMGLQSFMVGPALDTVIAQRLVRRVCPKCSKKVAVPEDLKPLVQKELQDIEKVTGQKIAMPQEIPQTVGCDFCSHTGYHGQIGLFELLYIDREVEKMIMQNSLPAKIYDYARAHGMLTLREDGVLKVLSGETTMQEVLRVTADQD